MTRRQKRNARKICLYVGHIWIGIHPSGLCRCTRCGVIQVIIPPEG